MAPARLLLQTHAEAEGGVTPGLPFSGWMTRDHAVTPGMMETKVLQHSATSHREKRKRTRKLS